MTLAPAFRVPPLVRLLILVPLTAALAFLATGCYTFGDESSWIRVQNIGGGTANLSVQFVDGGGQIIGERNCPGQCSPLAPGAGLTLRYQAANQFPPGILGSSVVGSNQPIAALMVSDVGRSRGRYQSAGDTFTTRTAGGTLLLPYIVVKSGPDGTWNSRIALQSLDPVNHACATLLYVGANGSPTIWEPYNPFAGGPAESGCPNGGERIGRGGSLFRDPASMPVPEGFEGTVQAIMHTTSQGIAPSQQAITGSAGVWNEQSMHFASFRGITKSELGTTILLPLVERNYAGFWSTNFRIQNPGPDATVTVRFQGRAGNQNVTRQNTFTVQGSTLCIQDDPARDCLGGGPSLPSGFQGSATITSNEQIAVVVHRSSWAQQVLSSYRGVRSGQATTRAYAPLVVKNRNSNNRTGEHSLLRFQVADGSTASVTIRYKNASGNTTTQGISVAGSRTLSLDSNALMLPNGFVGSAIIDSNKPMTTVVSLTTGHAAGDNQLMYNAVPP